jgi:alpha-tubulin suppressor-like RCC1 family protein
MIFSLCPASAAAKGIDEMVSLSLVPLRVSRLFSLILALAVLSPALSPSAFGQAIPAKLATGEGHGAWLKPDGTLWTWGSNRYGQLGRNGDDSESPVRVPGLSGVKDVACAANATFAVLGDGRVMTFGGNEYGQLGNGQVKDSAEPLPVPGLNNVVAVASAHRSTLALTSEGMVWEWGDDSKGSLPNQVAGLDGVIAIARAEAHGVALKKDGTVWVWGMYHGAGDLGNGCYGCAGEPIRVPDLSEVAAITAGYQLTVALKKDGTVWTIGYGEAGQLGDGTRRSVSRPVKVSNLAGVKAIAAGYMHVLALNGDGTVWAWGDNHYGELGNPGFNFSSKDIKPDNHPKPVHCGSLTNVVAIAAGGKHSLALTEKGKLYGFGDNGAGALGPDPESMNQADSPMEIGKSVPEPCQVLFSCQTASGKFIQICGEQDQTDVEKWRGITYRFGPANGPPELIYPKEPEKGRASLYFSHAEMGGDYQVSVRFVNGVYTYRVFSGSKSGAGVLVEDGKGKRVATVNCIERPQLYAAYLWKSLPCDQKNIHGAAACQEKPYQGR